ncbi:hypothetical protein DY000_02049192 [Brassica cretica]|uniref:Uncharacterized protein n=1 Tax=Brassica cretica TaxID=69181 RepID=A0ABQ7F9H1_BRACR|nr:hypothetical protein DY000_02049192 [Brassica cretica]
MISRIFIGHTGLIVSSFSIWPAQLRLPKLYGKVIAEPIFLSFTPVVLSPVSLSPGLEDETVAVTRKRRRSSKGALPGRSRPRFVSKGDGSLLAAQGDLISLAGRMRSTGCRLPSLASSAEKEAYAKVAVASSKVRFPPSFP